MDTSPQQIVRTTRFGKRQVLFDAALVKTPDEALFDPPRETRVDTAASSVGRAHVAIHRYQGLDVVSKHYYRGGMMAKFFEDIYFGIRAEHSRSFREWCMLSVMRRQGLPVPAPVAASVISSGLVYRADLATLLLPDVRSLSDACSAGDVDAATWRLVGATVRRFHDSNVYHADLNARNILLGADGGISMVDFDKGRFRKGGGSWRDDNLRRLRRSLDKFGRSDDGFGFSDRDWKDLVEGYG